MEAIHGKQRFKSADALFRAGRYEEALAALDALNSRYPNTRNVLFPMALCLERLGRQDEALQLCKTLVAEFQDRRAAEMEQRLRPTQLSLDAYAWASEYDLPDLGPMHTVPVPVQDDERPAPWVVASTVGGVSLTLLAILCAPFALQKLGLLEAPEAAPTAPSLSMLHVAVVLLGCALFQALGTGVASLALATVKKLPANTISGVLLNVGMTLLGANCTAVLVSVLLCAVAPLELFGTMFLLEHVVMLVFFWRVYHFSIGDVMIFFGFFFIFMCVAAFTTVLVFGTGLGVLATLLSYIESGS